MHGKAPRLKYWGLVGLGLAMFALNAIALYTVFTSRGSFVVWDVHPVLVAGQAVVHGQNPYSLQVTESIQRQAYGGRLPRPTEDPLFFSYPPYVAYLMIPLSLLPRPWAQALWLSLLETGVVTSLLMMTETRLWPRRKPFGALMFVFALCFYPVVWGFILGQVALVIWTLLVIFVWAVLRPSDGLAGVVLGALIIKPQIAFLILPSALVWAAFRRRWRIVATASVVILLMIVVSWGFLPAWFADIMKRLSVSDPYQGFAAPVVVVLQSCCKSVGWLSPLVMGIILIAVVYGWWIAAFRGRDQDFLWAIGMTLIATTAILPQVSIVSQVILLLPIGGVINLLVSKGRWGIVTAIVFLIVWSLGLWLLSFLPPVSTAQPRYPVEHRVLAPILPTTVGFFWLVAHPAFVQSSDSSK